MSNLLKKEISKNGNFHSNFKCIKSPLEYLQSGSEEVWLLFPENRWIIVITQQSRLVFSSGEIVSTQAVLNGFSIAVDELLA